MAARGTVLIIGGSMAGLFAAIALGARGWKVRVFERASGELLNRGAGIATHDELYAALGKAGVTLRDEMGVRSVGRIMFDTAGDEIGRVDMPQIMTSWGLIYRFLRAQVDDAVYHHDHALSAIEQHDDHVIARFANGSGERGDWLIGADGARSSVRDIVCPQVQPVYAGYYGWRGLIDEALVAPEVLEQVAYRMAMGMAPGGHWLGYLVAGPDDALEPGRRWYNWGWYRSGDDAQLRDLLTDADGTYYAGGIPHDRIRAEHVARMRTESHAYLAPQYRAIIAATRQPFLQGMYDFACQQLVHGRVILIGDAAATARPHVGLGVSKAADDASTLADVLGEADGALAAWDMERATYARQVLEWGRRLGSYIGPQPDSAAHRALAAYHRRPDVLMSETAANDPTRYLK